PAPASRCITERVAAAEAVSARTLLPYHVVAGPSGRSPAGVRAPGAPASRSRRSSATRGKRPRVEELPAAPVPTTVRNVSQTLTLPSHHSSLLRDHATSKRSRFITLFQAATKSRTSFCCPSALP